MTSNHLLKDIAIPSTEWLLAAVMIASAISFELLLAIGASVALWILILIEERL